MAFSPDSKRAMTASKDGTYKLWSLDVRYQLNEDAKCLYTRDQQVVDSPAVQPVGVTHADALCTLWP